jgi:RNA polymerase sigma factor (sigma-70 family)
MFSYCPVFGTKLISGLRHLAPIANKTFLRHYTGVGPGTAMSQTFSDRSMDDSMIARLDRQFRTRLLSYFRRRVKESAEADDLTQEVFLRIARRREPLANDNIEAFVFTIAGNLLRDQGRRAAVRGGAVSLDDEQVWSSTPSALVEVLHPDRVLIGKDDLRRALRALEELSERTRDVFILQRLEGMKNREIAVALGISVSAVEKHMVKALVHLSRRLDL